MKTKLIALFLCLACQPASAVLARGAPDCGEWFKTDPAEQLRTKSWLIGYLSGINTGFRIEKQRDFNYFDNATNAQIYLWMDKYCRDNPLSTVSVGSVVLFQEMSNK